MTEKDIRPIPKYILKLIQKLDKLNCPNPSGYNRFYAYLAIWKKELIKVTVAVKHSRKKLWCCKQVAFHGLHSKKCFVKDLEYCYVGMGFRVGWYDEGLQSEAKWYERGIGWADDKYYDPYAPIVNMEVIDKLPQFKYSAYKLYTGGDILKYLRLYEKYPHVEYLMKMNLSHLALKKTVLNLCKRDEKFKKWLISHKNELYPRYYVGSIIKAYKTNRPLKEVQDEEELLKELYRDNNYSRLPDEIKKQPLKFARYIEKQRTSVSSYSDYYTACVALKLDMSKDKNVFPHDFKRWHDIRIDQYNTQRTILAENNRRRRKILEERMKKERFERFARIANKYLSLEQFNRSGFVCIIAKSPDDLLNEGEILHHCVGRMNYDSRFIREESLIFFVRQKDDTQTPFVTVEYSPSKHKVLQCYGERDTKPTSDVLNYVNKVWLPYANRQIKKLAA